MMVAMAAAPDVRTGQDAFGDWRTDTPGVVRKITPADLGPPVTTSPSVQFPSVGPQPATASLSLPPGFAVKAYVKADGPRQMRTAPNGDIFITETMKGRVRVLRAPDGAEAPSANEVFAEGLDRPYGVTFYPAKAPQWVYVANTDNVVRYPYRAGDLKARGPAEVIVPKLVEKKQGHFTRDIVFSEDGRRMYISVGSGSNLAEQVKPITPEQVSEFARTHALGAAWGEELGRADVLVGDPDGKNLKVFATGIRNCVGMAVQPRTGDVWCGTNERDLLGDNLPPDYVTRVKPGAFYGWPWYYIGAHEDPRSNVRGVRPDLADKVTVPDVLLQPHSAPLGLGFYPQTNGASAFPKALQGQLFVTLHGSWNRGKRTGYKVARVVLKDGVPTGEYEDFLTGFVTDDKTVWGRPVGVSVAHDGAMLVSDDASNTIWRITYKGPTAR
jgi:glucose/arabinose dehydrogenase